MPLKPARKGIRYEVPAARGQGARPALPDSPIYLDLAEIFSALD